MSWVILPYSLRVAVFGFLIVIFAVALVFLLLLVFLLVWLLPREEIVSHQAITRASVGEFWMYSAHAQSYASNGFLFGSDNPVSAFSPVLIPQPLPRN